MDDCRFSYDSGNNNDNVPSSGASWLLRDMTLNVTVGSRIGILGRNGAGKSTLVKLLCGELSPDPSRGTLRRRPGLKIAHISQHHIERLGNHLEETPVEYIRIRDDGWDTATTTTTTAARTTTTTAGDDGDDREIRRFLGRFGLVGSLALRPIGSLSGGQKARLAFAAAMRQPPHVLVLDEPTNHLDRDSLESLSGAVAGFGGAVVVVSHHRAFLSRTCREVWTIGENGRVATEAVETDRDHRAGGRSGVGGGTPFDVVYESYKKSLRKNISGARRTRVR